MKFFLLGLATLFLGMFLLNVNLWLGVVVIGVGGITAKWFQGAATQKIVNMAIKKGQRK